MSKLTAEIRKLGNILSDSLAEFGGSWSFIFWFIGLSMLYMVYNVVGSHKFDLWPYAGLNLMLGFISSLSAPIIMMSSNRQDAKKRKQIEEDLKTGHDSNKLIKQLQKDIEEIKELIKK